MMHLRDGNEQFSFSALRFLDIKKSSTVRLVFSRNDAKVNEQLNSFYE